MYNTCTHRWHLARYKRLGNRKTRVCGRPVGDRTCQTGSERAGKELGLGSTCRRYTRSWTPRRRLWKGTRIDTATTTTTTTRTEAVLNASAGKITSTSSDTNVH